MTYDLYPCPVLADSDPRVNLTALGLLALPHRARELAQLPEVTVDLPPDLSGIYSAFTRASIHASLGGSMGGFLVRCALNALSISRL